MPGTAPRAYREAETVTRETQEPDVIYTDHDEAATFVTHDGIGRHWYDSLAEAQEDRGDDLPVVHLDTMPAD